MNFKKLLSFLANLSQNNNKPWFDAHKSEYDALRKEWLAFIQDCIVEFGKIEPAIVHFEAKDCVFRINRDVRFSTNKDPYKNNFAMILQQGGRKSPFGGYYLHIQPGNSFIAGGVWQPNSEQLSAIRQEIDYHAKEFVEIITNKNFIKHFGKLSGEVLQRPPKGYEADNPMIQFIKHKSFIVEHALSDKDIQDPKFNALLLEKFAMIKPLNDFLNKAIEV